MAHDALNTVVPPDVVKPSDVEANKMFVARRVSSLSTMMLNMAKSGKKSHVVQIVRKPLLADIAAGLKVNFPDSKVDVDDVTSTITVDWS